MLDKDEIEKLLEGWNQERRAREADPAYIRICQIGELYQHQLVALPPELMAEDDLVEHFLLHNHHNFRWMPLKYREDTYYINDHVQGNIDNLRFVGKRALNSGEAMKYVCSYNPAAMEYVSERLRNSPEFFKRNVSNPDVFIYTGQPVKSDLCVAVKVLAQRQCYLKFVDESIRNHPLVQFVATRAIHPDIRYEAVKLLLEHLDIDIQEPEAFKPEIIDNLAYLRMLIAASLNAPIQEEALPTL